MNMPFRFLFLLLFVVVSSCNCTEGTGPVQSEKRELKEFKSIALDFPADVIVLKGGTTSVNVEAQGNLLSKIETKVSGSTLKIKSDGCFNSSEKIKITVYLPELEEMEINGSGNILVPDTFVVHALSLNINGSGTINGKFIAAKIESDISGSGTITLEGSADKQDAEISGSGNINAKNLPCNEADIEINGSGDVSAYVIKNLDVSVSGSGNARYRGKPIVNSHVSGSGKVIDEN